MDWLASLFGRNGYLPHGYCFTWSPDLLWTMVVSDLVIATSYLSIPVAIAYFVRRRPGSSGNWVAWLFSAFILACGTTHLMDVWTIWRPDYGVQALTKVVTAAVSIGTALALWPMMPKALKVPSVDSLKTAINALEAEVRRRHSAEDQLREIQANLSVTLASIGAGFIATDREGRVTRINGVAERITGYAQGEARGQPYWTVFRHDGRPTHLEQKNPVDVMMGQDVTIDQVQEVVGLARDGRRTPLAVQSAMTREEDGTVRGIAVVLRDMTESVRAQKESATLAAIVESSGDAIISHSLHGQITTWNRAAQSLFGYTAEQAIGQSVKMLVPPDRLDDEMRILASLSQGAPIPAYDTLRRARDGRVLEVSITISPIADRAGHLIGASKIVRDISRQRRYEIALRDSEERLRFTLEAAHIGDWTLDMDTGAMQHSLRHDCCFGFDHPVPDWSLERFVRVVHPDDRPEVERTLAQAMAERRDLNLQCRVVWPDGSVHWIAKRGSVQDKSGEAAYMLGIVSDITAQREAEDARLEAQRLEVENRQIQEASRLKSEFLANMSHELRTPLNAVIGFADLLHSGFIEPESPKHHEFLGHIGTSGRHLLQLINDVLDLSKIESGKFDFYPEAVDLPALLGEVTDVLRMAIERKRIALSAEIDPSLTDLKLDPARLKQVLYNYLSNAIKFTPIDGRVLVRAIAADAEHLRIEVEDNGIGISETDLPRLFVDFQQLDSGYNKQHPGTGLGLALTRRLVHAQGGSVGVRSTLGAGSVFHVVLNRVHGTDAVRHEVVDGEARPLQQRVLVIEADEDEQARLMRALSAAGFQVDAVAESEDALRRARGSAYSAFTLDLQLPDQKGLELLANIRSHGESRATPVIGVSMQADDRAATFAIANLLAKPIRSEEIRAAMVPFGTAGSGRANILVIDDEPAALDMMRATLMSIGVDAVCLQDGREALARIDSIRPDAIILDLMMPGFDGFQVLDALQHMTAWRHVPVFIWTSLLLTDAEYTTLAQSARAILIKGGGAMEGALESIRRWRLPLAATPDETPR